MGFTTKILHTKFPKKDSYGALRFPTYGNAAFEFDSAEDIEAAFKGTKPAHAYSRSTNPSVEYLEKTISQVTDALGCIAVSSGMAATSNCVFALVKSGDEIISSNKLFGTTYSFFKDTLANFGITVKFVDFQNLQEVENAITPQTRLLFFETITNPQIEIFDLENIVDIAKKHNLISIADITTTPPFIFNSKNWGIDISIISSTKFMSGGGTAIGGFIIDNGLFNWANHLHLSKDAAKFGQLSFIRKLRLETYRNIGACMSAHNATLFSLGLETLELRIERACSNAQKVAELLNNHKKVAKVHYAGLSSNTYNNLAKKYFTYPGSIICFELNSKQECFTFINALSIIRRATNLHDNKSLIIHPSSTIYSEFGLPEQAQIGVFDTMIRLSVGIENIEDIDADIIQALEKL